MAYIGGSFHSTSSSCLIMKSKGGGGGGKKEERKQEMHQATGTFQGAEQKDGQTDQTIKTDQEVDPLTLRQLYLTDACCHGYSATRCLFIR